MEIFRHLKNRVNEPTITYEKLLADLKRKKNIELKKRSAEKKI